MGMPFIPNTEQQQQEILQTLGLKSFDDLITEVPESIRFKGEFSLPDPLSELEAFRLLKSMAKANKNIDDYACFLGGGAYDHYAPAAIDHIISRPEFYTAYTPYQPEVSQGTLQAAFEYQTMICELTGMDVTNASLYDGGTALAEAALLAHRNSRNCDHLLISKGINPNYHRIIETYCRGQGIELKEIPLTTGLITDVEKLKSLISQSTCGVIVQHPNYFGNLEEVFETDKIIHSTNALYIVSVDPISLGILVPPGNYNADIVTGEGQVLGNSLSFGGPYLGLFSVKKELIRRMPGRVIGETVDSEGRRGFVMTLQTREQHIRREKATSNICTNQALNTLVATIYLSLLGKRGIREVAEQSLQRSHYLADQIANLPNFSLLNSGHFFKEFVVSCPVPAREVIGKLKKQNVFAGIDLGKTDKTRENQLLVAVTEKRTKEEMDRYVAG
ncbi:MAG TPA: aminomethyl-transferring glycine dehydrogenase subunit GcvPA, partial [Bacteroidetes bacterium]|nr:aminomethyl-transferring glycine dehydrogenase subunit GcvPA [Bacteroidota bacterium]